MTRKLDTFLVAYFRSHNDSPRRLAWLDWLQPPDFQVRWVNRDPNPYDGEARVRAVRIRYIEEYFREGKTTLLRDQILHRVEIPELREPQGRDPS